MRRQIKPDELLPGDRFKPRAGSMAGTCVEVVDVLRGRYSTYRVVVRVIDTVEVGLDYTESLAVDRSEAPA